MASRKRSGSGSKRQLKEKVVQIYEAFFRGEDISRSNANIWEELFLLKPKVNYFETEMLKLSGDQLVDVQDNLHKLFTHCIETLGHKHNIRVVYAMQTLCALVDCSYKRCPNDAMNLLMGVHTAEKHMQQLLAQCNTILSGDSPASLKNLCLKLLLILVTGADNVSTNFLLEYVMMNSIFETLIQLLCDGDSRLRHGHDVVSLLTLLINYRKHEAPNPYVVKLSILDDELALNGYGQVIARSLAEFCCQFSMQVSEPQVSGWLSSFSSMVGNMFISEEIEKRTQQIRANNGLLLALYEAVHLNRNFVTTLAHCRTDAQTDALAAADDITASGELTDTQQPSNLLVTFFQYCSIVMQDTKSEASVNNVKLCFIILTCVAEDQYANSLMHDANLLFKVRLHRMPMRHRKFTQEEGAQPLANTLMDLLVEFIMSHMMKKLSLELYLQCVGVAHRVLCYQKRCRVRLTYKWKRLWTSLITLLKFLLANENHLAKRINIFLLGLQVVNIFNLFITYGDTFLPSPNSYDELYYELIRMHQVFDNVYSTAFRYSTIDGEFKDSALQLTNSLINIRAIINHFSPKIDSWLDGQSLSTPSEDEILEVVRKNYDSLTLKLQDSLDQYERYSENPQHCSFFTSMVRSVVIDTRQNIDYTSLDLQVILQELSCIS